MDEKPTDLSRVGGTWYLVTPYIKKETRYRNLLYFSYSDCYSSALGLAAQEIEFARTGIVGKMKIFVKTLKGTHFEIQVNPEDTVCFFLLALVCLFFFSF